MNPDTRIKWTFLIGACISVAGIVLRFSARSLVTTQMAADIWSIDEAAQQQLQQDGRLIILFGLSLILVACHRWLWLPQCSDDTPATAK